MRSLKAERYLERIVFREGDGLVARLLRFILTILSGLYYFGLSIYLSLYRFGILRRVRLPCQVISIGNLTLGGTGKTSFAFTLARKLALLGKRVALLCYGYEGRAKGKANVVSDGNVLKMSAEEAGDEAYMLARNLLEFSVPVLTGKNRISSGIKAIKEFGSEVLILDDGFQYFPLMKDLEIVLIDALNPFGNNRLFPRGILREPPANLRRADILVLSNSNLVEESEKARLKSFVSQFCPRTKIIESFYVPVYLLSDTQELSPEAIRSKTCVALSSIGNPLSFELTLQKLNPKKILPLRYPDHYPYRLKDLKEIEKKCQKEGAEFIITTEKDAVRLPKNAFLSFPILVLGVRMNCEEGFQEVLDQACRRLACPRQVEFRGIPHRGILASTIKRIQKFLGRVAIISLRWLTNRLPLRFIYLLGDFLGDFAYLFSRRYREVALENLRLAFRNGENTSEIKVIARKTFRNFAKALLEFLQFPRLEKEDIDKMVSLTGRENFDVALASGNGAILLTAHLDNWELMGAKLVQEGYPLVVIAQDQEDPVATVFLNRLRESKGYQVISARNPTWTALRNLRRNKILGILADQDAPQGVFVDFFGQAASTVTGPVTFALRTGAPIVPAFIVREPDETHKITIEKPLKLEITGDKNRDILVNTQKITKIIESWVRKYPEQWFWLHRRWKRKPKPACRGGQRGRRGS